jgi:hypothetical protein
MGAYLTGRSRCGAETDVNPSVFALLLSSLACFAGRLIEASRP